MSYSEELAAARRLVLEDDCRTSGHLPDRVIRYRDVPGLGDSLDPMYIICKCGQVAWSPRTWQEPS